MKVGFNEYLVSDYHSVWWTHLPPSGQPTLHRLNPDMVPGRWNPTGLKIQGDTLYIANYMGQNILEYRYSRNMLLYIRQYRLAEMKTPENIDVRDGVAYIADYDGNQIIALHLSAGEALWTAYLPLAHGVAAGPNAIYGTGLSGTGLVVLDPGTGVDLYRTQPDSPSAEWAYPTVVQSDGSANLLVIDANRGRVLFTDDRGRSIAEWGGNGGLDSQFNRPYGVLRDGTDILVGDTFKQRIVRLNDRGEYLNSISFRSIVGVGQKPLEYVGVCSGEPVPDWIGEVIKRAYSLPEDVHFLLGSQQLCLRGDDALLGANPFLVLASFGSYMSDTRPSGTPHTDPWMHESTRDGRRLWIVGAKDNREIWIVDSRTLTARTLKINSQYQIWSSDPDDPTWRRIEDAAWDMTHRFDGLLESCGRDTLVAWAAESLRSNPNPPVDWFGALTYWSNDAEPRPSEWLARGERLALEDALWFALGPPSKAQQQAFPTCHGIAMQLMPL